MSYLEVAERCLETVSVGTCGKHADFHRVVCFNPCVTHHVILLVVERIENFNGIESTDCLDPDEVNGTVKRWKEISGNGTIVTWKKNDLEDCVDYYSVIDTAYMSALDTMYSGLTTKNKLFMILLHNGKSDAQIRDIFGVSPNAVRTIRSRIKGKLVSLPPDRS